jgi:hypothetical protein
MSWNEVESGGVWKPKDVGEKLEGVLKSRKIALGKNNVNYTIFTIEEPNGEERNVSGAVLESKLADIEDGTKILLTYKGKPKGTYLDFTVMQWQDEPSL